MNDQYSNRELDAKFGAVHEKLDDIIIRVTYTNGKLKKITLALFALAFFCLGLGISQPQLFTLILALV
jgi:hypothetical protein